MRKIPDEFLYRQAEAVLRSGGSVKLKIGGDSMLPFLHGGSDTVVLVPATPEALYRGAAVLARYEEKYVLHRIIACYSGVYDLCGDGNCGPGERVRAADVIGVLHCVERPSGRVVYCCSSGWRFCSACWMLLRPLRRYLLKIYRMF